MTGGPPRYPPLDPSYLWLLTDDTGLIQHAIFSVPNRPTGYTTDDNARALIVAVQEYERTRSPEALRRASVYLAFLYHALTPDNFFHNLMSYERHWIDVRGSEDCYGRALWAVGYTATAAVPRDLAHAARQVFDDTLPWASRLRSPRAVAYSMMGISSYARHYALGDLPTRLANQLAAGYDRHRDSGWEWYEQSLSYSNAMLPNALLLAHEIVGDERYREVAEATLEFLVRVTVMDDVLYPVGCHGWYTRGGVRAWFDQQPVDVTAMVLACLSAWRVLGKERYRDLAVLCFDWFFGRNGLGQRLVNAETGGCHDGITPEGLNRNQGAEAQVAYLMAHLAMDRAGLVPRG